MARQVSILGPRGYEPRTLPLRHVPSGHPRKDMVEDEQ